MKQLTNDVINPIRWGKKIEEVRHCLDIHQDALCAEAGVSPCTYQKIKRGGERDMIACYASWSACAGQ